MQSGGILEDVLAHGAKDAICANDGVKSLLGAVDKSQLGTGARGFYRLQLLIGMQSILG